MSWTVPARLLVAGLALLGAAACSPRPWPSAAEQVDRPPQLDPDYANVTVPPNIAPLNFTVAESGRAFQVRLEAAGGQVLAVASDQAQIRLPQAGWRRLLGAARGGSISLRIAARQSDGTWRAYTPVAIHVAAVPIDPVLLYRRFKPLYSKFVEMGIYQRDLETYRETAVLHSRNTGGACLNCHTLNAQDPDWFSLQTRGPHGMTMLLARQHQVRNVDTRTAFSPAPAAYTAWHPDGSAIAFTVNKLSLFHHTHGETRDVFDAASDLALYRVDDNVLAAAAGIARPDSLENWPHWAPDGLHLYFSRAPALPVEQFDAVRYDLMRAEFEPRTGRFGRVETVLPAAVTGLSITQPKVSPDGRHVVVTMAAYGNFPVYRREADLYIVDLATGAWRPLASNSDECDSWHCWSSNGRWLVFSSKRRDGLFARPHIAYIDSAGHAARPFVVPQRDPSFYRASVETFNVPELARGPVPVPTWELAAALRDTARVVRARLDPAAVPAATTPLAGAPEPYSSGAVGSGAARRASAGPGVLVAPPAGATGRH